MNFRLNSSAADFYHWILRYRSDKEVSFDLIRIFLKESGRLPYEYSDSGLYSVIYFDSLNWAGP